MTEPRVWCAAVLAMLVLVLVLAVSSGCCNFDYVPNHDIVVLKLDPVGALEWTRVIDHGFDDAGKDLIELPDGGYAIAGQTSNRRIGQPRSVLSPPQPLLIRLSPEGTVEWDRLVTDGFDVANAVVSEGDGGTAVLTGNGTVVRFDPTGRTLWARGTGIPEASALVATADGGYLAGGRIMHEALVNDTAGPGTVVRLPVRTTTTGRGGDGSVLAVAASRPTTPQLIEIPRRFDLVRRAMVVRLAPDGAIVWERQYDEGGIAGVSALAGGPADTGFLPVGEASPPNGTYSNSLLAFPPDSAGTPGRTTPLGDPASSQWSVLVRTEGDAYRVLYQPIRISRENYYGSVEDTLLSPTEGALERSVLQARAVDVSLNPSKNGDASPSHN